MEATLERIRFSSSGIRRAGDETKLEAMLAGVEGVRRVDVDPNGHCVDVTYDSAIVDANRIRAEVEDAGYKIEGDHETLTPDFSAGTTAP